MKYYWKYVQCFCYTKCCYTVLPVCYHGNLGLWSFVSRSFFLQILSAFYYPYVTYPVGFMVSLQWHLSSYLPGLWCCCGGFNHGLCTQNSLTSFHLNENPIEVGYHWRTYDCDMTYMVGWSLMVCWDVDFEWD